MARMKIRLWQWILIVTAANIFERCIARESRKEPNIAASSLGENLLGEGASPPARQHEDTAKDRSIEIDYDYFMFGVQKSVSDKAKQNEPKNSAPSSTRGEENPSEDLISYSQRPKNQDYAYYNYDDYSRPKGSSDNNGEYAHGEEHDDQDPFSVFYDSLFSVVDEAEVDNMYAKDKTAIAKESMKPPPPERTYVPRLPSPSPTPSQSPSQSPSLSPSLSQQKPPAASLKPVHRPIHPKYPPRRNNSTPLRYQKVPRPKPVGHRPIPPSKTNNTSKPMDLTHLKILMPKILEQFGLPKSFGEKLFKNEAALQDTILQIMKDKTFQNALSMLPNMDLLNTDMTSLLGSLSSIDPTIIMTLLKNADLSKITSLMSNLGIDLSYISGVFNRAGAAAQYSTKDDGDDDSKLIYIPLVDTGTVNNVQVTGFVVIMFFLLTTAYAYLKFGAFAKPRQDRVPSYQTVTNEQILGFGDTSDIWLPVVEAIEDENQWNPPPPIHILHGSHTDPPRPVSLPPPPPRPPTLAPRPHTLPPRPPRPPTQPPRQHTLPPRRHALPARPIVTAPPKRMTLAPPRARPVYRPIRRRFRPKIRRRYQQIYQPTKSESPVYMDSQEIRQLTRRRPVFRPMDRIERLEPVYYDYYEDYYHDDGDYLYEDDYDYYEQGSYREGGESAGVGSISYKYYPATKKPEDHPYSYYSFPGPRATEGTKKTTTPKTTTTTTTTTPTTITTTSPSTRPTSRYADTIKTALPFFTSLRE